MNAPSFTRSSGDGEHRTWRFDLTRGKAIPAQPSPAPGALSRHFGNTEILRQILKDPNITLVSADLRKRVLDLSIQSNENPNWEIQALQEIDRAFRSLDQ